MCATPRRAPFHGTAFRLGLLALAFIMPAAHAARPMITDDARIVDAKSCQLEAWVRHSPSGQEDWALPGCNPFGGVEFTAGGAKLGNGGPSGALLAQGKTLFQTLESSSLAWGMALGVTRNTPGGPTEPYGYMPITWAVSADRLYLHANIGARRDVAGHTTQPTWGLGVESILTKRFGVIAEAFSQERGRSQYQGGLRLWIVPDRVQIDATVGNRSGHAPGQGSDRWVSIGLRLLSPPFLP